ncbi:hypothetical protein [Sphingomonas sp.]|uniref:hypothetical protein n=1 Tax=Sphingomonas sp. TaxID=28214 RepID=UPI002DD67827|nr:hypothetical protein [Sphingomonas sp.]
MHEIIKPRFDALAGYVRAPQILSLVQEAAWFASDGERLLGLIVWDRIDHDFGWVVLGRDRKARFRAIAQDASLPSFAAARDALDTAIDLYHRQPDEDYHQGDERGRPIDFFAPVVPAARLNPNFRTLAEQPRYSPARDLVAAMMRFHEDTDGNFIEQFQTTGCDARLWELYLYAAFTEIGYAMRPDAVIPDLVLSGRLGRIAIEATTANPPQGVAVPPHRTRQEIDAYLADYVPIKLARALTRKLNHPQPYWQADSVDGAPFVIALQDFHAPGAMTRIVPIATEYVFGVRHSIVEGAIQIERIGEHSFGRMREPSGFFDLPNAENVSAVILNPLGTLTKFNRMGQIAGFGDPRVRMVRQGLARGESNDVDPRPFNFRHDVSKPEYTESWVEGMVVLHNPRALIPLEPDQIPYANHEFLQPDGRIMSLLPEFQPYMSNTSITLDGTTETVPDEGGPEIDA